MKECIKVITDGVKKNAKWLLLGMTALASLAISRFEEKEQQEYIDHAVAERMNALMAGDNPDEEEESEEDEEDSEEES
ncbi:MAG: hypothetical protein E7576_06920 [Ruminococcaceae bacterium]|nr:hypothetical protein [Oscillospiraceae bacterium]